MVCGPALAAAGLGLGAFALVAHPAIAASPLWSHFVLRIITFLVFVVFVVWPVLSAGVDEHSELSRFATFPIRPVEFDIPQQATAGGNLKLSWTQTPGRGSSGRG